MRGRNRLSIALCRTSNTNSRYLHLDPTRCSSQDDASLQLHVSNVYSFMYVVMPRCCQFLYLSNESPKLVAQTPCSSLAFCPKAAAKCMTVTEACTAAAVLLCYLADLPRPQLHADRISVRKQHKSNGNEKHSAAATMEEPVPKLPSSSSESIFSMAACCGR